MSDSAQIRKAADSHQASLYVDANVPKGYFVFSATIRGTVTDYLLKGTLERSEEGHIVGRVEQIDNRRGIPYKGTGLTGGNSLGETLGYDKAFSKLVR